MNKSTELIDFFTIYFVYFARVRKLDPYKFNGNDVYISKQGLLVTRMVIPIS